jgi:hypothetical protein
MRLRSRLLILPFIFTSVVATAAEAQSTCAHWKGGDLQLAGRVGSADVAVYLETTGDDDDTLVTGLIMFTGRWHAGTHEDGLAAFLGPVNGCSLKLTAMRGEGEWDLRIVAPTRIEGTRRAADRTEPVALAVAAPFDCTAGPWRTFSRRDWPMTFEYPASARLGGDADVDVACPDVSRIVWNARPLTIRHSRVETSPLPEGRQRTQVGPFYSDAPGQWFVNDRDACGPNPDANGDDDIVRECEPASVASWRGLTVLQGTSSGEDRRYRPGGGNYLGQGGGLVYYALLLGKDAILVAGDELPEEIAGVDGPDEPDDRSTGRMMKRVVRSLKRR